MQYHVAKIVLFVAKITALFIVNLVNLYYICIVINNTQKTIAAAAIKKKTGTK